MDLVDEGPVEGGGQLGAPRREPAHHPRCPDDVVEVPAGVDPLGRVGEGEVRSGHEPRPVQDGPDHLLRGPRVGGGLQDHERAGPHVTADPPGGGLSGRQVGLVVPQRGGDADQDDVALAQCRVLGGEANPVE